MGKRRLATKTHVWRLEMCCKTHTKKGGLPELDTNDAILVQNKHFTKIVKELLEQLAKIP